MSGAKIFSLQELERATSNWSGANVLGTGGFATVFLAVLPTNERVAIKKVTIPKDERERDFALKGL